VILLLIVSSHAPLDALEAVSLQNFRVFQQPAREPQNLKLSLLPPTSRRETDRGAA
jgi:hypothetical protein